MNDPITSIKEYVRATNYLAVTQIYLQDNVLLQAPLKPEHIKPKPLGHWGTCPGINFVYGHLNHFIKRHDASTIFVLGPGHGFPALQAGLFLEGTLGEYYPEATHTEEGIRHISRLFSWPYGFPSHSNPGAPGAIVEGGELGYALSTSYGAILDNPDLIAACLVGDGEAETGPTATAWHLNKFIDPAHNGAVLPILHCNGYKISGPTIFGRMSNKELKALFHGYGYEPFIVEGTNATIYEKMYKTLDTCYEKIKDIQTRARAGEKIIAPRFPMIILKTPKGWTGIKKLHGEKIEGNCLSHQVTVPNVQTDKEERKALEKWLKSYKFNELFQKETGFSSSIREIIPTSDLRMGANPHAHGAKIRRDLILPDIAPFTEDATIPGTIGSSSMRRAGAYLNEVFKQNKSQRNFRLMSPDETYSNKLDEVFKTTTRAFMLPIESWDKDISTDGRVMEMLSEHSLQGMAQGYILTGRHTVFASYEAFVQVISSMADQYTKFLKISQQFPWRKGVSSLNYILTSSGWRQEHNGYSHQNPGFIGDMLEKKGCPVHVYFPPDGNSTLAVLKKCLASQDGINIIAAGKTVEPRWLTEEDVEKELERGLMIWNFASDENPDLVIASIGDYLTKEALAGLSYIKKDLPNIRIRFVNILELSTRGIGNVDYVGPSHEFNDYFTSDKPVIFNYHGYPDHLKPMLFERGNSTRFKVNGYIENGSTTTPFDMHIRNKTSRFHIAIDAFTLLREHNVISDEVTEPLVALYRKKIEDHGIFIRIHGIDPDEIELWQWKPRHS